MIRHLIIRLYGRQYAPEVLSRRDIVVDRSKFYSFRKLCTFFILKSCINQLNLQQLNVLDDSYYLNKHHGISAVDHIIHVVQNERRKRFIDFSFRVKPPKMCRTRTMHFSTRESIEKCALKAWE